MVCRRGGRSHGSKAPRTARRGSSAVQRRPLRTRAARRAAGLTQEQVVLRIETDRATYNRIEMGHSAALLDSLILIADATGVSSSDLVGE
ncbi:hypothetical protein GCM10010327_14140 [Streptomyces nitrosporeus]|nr:hypothetical protein GCM10010327_14140 [Streptomyces nitrosporeus]